MFNAVGIGIIADIVIMPATQDATLRLYTKTDITGQVLPINWSDTAAVRDAIAHELGHYLGLDHTNCFGYIMSPALVTPMSGMATIAPTRSVKEEECFRADQECSTDWEEDEISCQLDPTCDPNAPCGPFCCPIIIDFDGGEISLSEGPVVFDIDANGTTEQLTWVDGESRDYFLVLDRNQNGRVDDGRELFGSGTPLSNGYIAPHGYVAMRELDSPDHGGNGDGFLSRSDVQFSSLLLWHDGNQNAISESWEIKKADQAGLIWIDLSFLSTERIDEFGNNLKYASPALIRRGDQIIKTWAFDAFFRRVDNE